MGQRCEEQLSDGHKEGTVCFLSKLDRPIMLSSNIWTFSGGFFIGITIHCSVWPCSSGRAGWSREGVLNKVIYLYSRASQSVHYWYFQFSSVAQLCPTLCDPMDWAHQASLSSITSQSLLNFMSIELVMLTILSPATLLSSCLQSFPASGSFLMSQLFTSSGQSIGASASISVLPMNINSLAWIAFYMEFCPVHWRCLAAFMTTH